MSIFFYPFCVLVIPFCMQIYTFSLIFSKNLGLNKENCHILVKVCSLVSHLRDTNEPL